jgi:serine protease Do
MKTSFLLLSAFLLLQSSTSSAQQSRSWSRQRETVILNRSFSGPATIEINNNGIYFNGEQVATRSDINSRNLNKRIIIHSDDNAYNNGDNSGRGNDYGNNTAKRALLGVYTDNDRSDDGAYIRSVTPNSAADAAGLREGDLITKVDDQKVKGADDLTNIVGRYKPGDRITISYSRNSHDRQTTATLGAADAWGDSFGDFDRNDNWPPIPPSFPGNDYDNNNKPMLGVAVENTTNRRGVRVITVRPNSPASRAGLEPDDVITSIGNRNVYNISDLQREVSNLSWGTNVGLDIMRDGRRLSKTVYLSDNLNGADF